MRPASNSRQVLQLAISTLRAARNSGKNFAALTVSFRELTAAIEASNPPPTLPRFPTAYTPTLEQEQQLKRIQNRASQIIPEVTVRDPNVRPLDLVNQTYGTTPTTTIDTLLEVIYPNSKVSSGMFVDAGSGMGLPTLAAALSNRFPVARGIEYERKWHNEAKVLQEAYQKEPDNEGRGRLEYICGDMTSPGYFKGATCVFLNCVTFNADLCQRVGERLDLDTISTSGEKEEEVYVISMSRRLALPSFDLVDVLRLDANGGKFTFFVNRKASSRSSLSHHNATTDSDSMRLLRDTNTILNELVDLATGLEDKVGLPLLAAMAFSEPTVRVMTTQQALWQCLEKSLQQAAGLSTKALGSMVLRSMVDHPIGRREVSKQRSLLLNLLATVCRKNEHPAVRANLLDSLSNLLLDSPLDLVSVELCRVLVKMQEETGTADTSVNIMEALEEIKATKRWWEGYERVLPGSGQYSS